MNNTTKRLLKWAGIVLLLLIIPLVLTIRDGNVPNVGWNWSPFDFVFAWVLVFGAGAVYELVAKRMTSVAYRTGVAIAVVFSLALIWINGAVGIIGDEGGINMLYAVVLFAGAIGAMIARLKPQGMCITLFIMAIIQFLIPLVALIFSSEVVNQTPGVVGVLILNGIFVVAFFAAGMLFKHASITPSN